MSEIKFGTDGWRAIIGETYTNDNVARVSDATAQWLKNKNSNAKVVLVTTVDLVEECFPK